MIKRILVALSGTPFTHSAVQNALALAGRHGAELTGVTLVDTKRLEDVGPVPIGGGAAAHALAEHRLHVTEDRVESVVEAFVTACREAGTPHRVVRESGDSMHELIALWRYHDLTVIGLRGLFEYGVVHNPDDTILRLMQRGVRPILAVAQEPRHVRRVLIAYNGSVEAAKAMKRFVQMRLWDDVELKIVCFDGRDGADRLLADAADYCRAHDYASEIAHVPEPPGTGLLPYAKGWQADLIVLGTVSRGKLLKLVFGDTTLHAMRDSPVPLFLSQ